MAEPADVQAAVDRLAERLGRSVLIEDTHRQQPLFWSAQGAVDGTRMRSILDRRVDPEVATVVRRLRLAQATTPVRTPAVPEADMWARWCMPVRHEGRLLGYLWVLDPDGTVTDAELPLLVDCADLAAEALAKTRQSAERTQHLREEYLDRLVQGPDAEAARELARLERLPHDVRIQVHAPARPGGWRLPAGMSAHVPGTPRRGTGPATSGAALPLIELHEAVRRAGATRRAIAAGARPDPPSWDALGAWRLIVDAPRTLSVADLHPAAEVLASQDRGDLMTTARLVLDHGGDVAAAAKALHLHRTSLYYRLDRIKDLTGVDLRDGGSRTDLQLALWLAAYRGTDA